MFVKEVSTETFDNELELQTIASKYGFSPRILNHATLDNSCRIVMDDLEAECLAEIYGDDPDNIPQWIWNEIRSMIFTLMDQEGIEYVDITPYNFFEKDNRIYMIDFGDAKYSEGCPDWFLTEFLDGENSWNPDYK